MTGIIHHTCRRIAWGQSRHTYLIESGKIPIRIVPEAGQGDSCRQVLTAAVTRYFEVVIDEKRSRGKKSSVFQGIFPVIAHKNPDWRILKFRVRRGKWKTERIPSRHDPAGYQWIYTDDFNILFLSSGGRFDNEALIDLIIAKLDSITRAIADGSPLLSEYESQRACRDAFGILFTEGIEGAFRDTILYRQNSGSLSGASSTGIPVSSAGIGASHGKAPALSRESAAANVDISRIEELNDLSWLME